MFLLKLTFLRYTVLVFTRMPFNAGLHAVFLMVTRERWLWEGRGKVPFSCHCMKGTNCHMACDCRRQARRPGRVRVCQVVHCIVARKSLFSPILLSGQRARSASLRVGFLPELFGILPHAKSASSLLRLHSLIRSVDNRYPRVRAVLWDAEQCCFMLLLKSFRLCHREPFQVAPLSL